MFSDEEIKQSPQICTLQSCYETYQKFIKVCISLLSIFGLNMNQDEDQFDQTLKDLLQEKYPDTDLEELRSKIDDIEIKNVVKSTRGGSKIPRFNLKVYTFVYDSMIDFSASNIMYDAITAVNFLEMFIV